MNSGVGRVIASPSTSCSFSVTWQSLKSRCVLVRSVATRCRSRAARRRGEGQPRLRWNNPAAPAASKRRLRRLTCRTVTANAVATSRPVTRRATKALSNPIRGASFRLIVSVSHGFMR